MYNICIDFLTEFVQLLPVLVGIRIILDAIRNYIFGNLGGL